MWFVIFSRIYSVTFNPLKVLSSEMDPIETRLIRYVVIKDRGAEGFRKICPSPLKYLSSSVFYNLQ
jgi:hypothetical protein